MTFTVKHLALAMAPLALILSLSACEPEGAAVDSGASGDAPPEFVVAATDYAFDLADDPLLAPLLLYVSVNGVLASRERTVGSLTLGVGEGSVIRLEGRDEVALDNLFSGATAADYATGLSAYILHLVMNNEWAEARVTGVNLLLQYEVHLRAAPGRHDLRQR